MISDFGFQISDFGMENSRQNRDFEPYWVRWTCDGSVRGAQYQNSSEFSGTVVVSSWTHEQYSYRSRTLGTRRKGGFA